MSDTRKMRRRSVAFNSDRCNRWVAIELGYHDRAEIGGDVRRPIDATGRHLGKLAAQIVGDSQLEV